MREIKFRAWDEELETMVYSHELTGGVEYDCHPVRAINIILNEDDYSCEFMQYTGLKDKKGHEIYEGDILKGARKESVVVSYSNGAFGFTYLGRNSFYNDKKALFFRFLGEVDIHSLKVIGNIYENPELLDS